MKVGFLWRRAAARPLDCRRVGKWLQRYLDGELDHVRDQAVSRHLEDCRRCGMEAATYRELKASIARAAPGDVDPESLKRLRAFANRLAAGEVDATAPDDNGYPRTDQNGRP